MNLTEAQCVWLVRRAIQAAPHEACGFILGEQIVEVRNIFHDPSRGFLMDRYDLKDIDPQDISAIWHTHPGGSITPSKGDVDSMVEYGRLWPHWQYFIVTAAHGIHEYFPNSYAPQPDSFWNDFAKST